MILPLGTRVQSLRDTKIVGTIRGYGTLFVHRNIDNTAPRHTNPVITYLVWNDRSPGSNSEINPTVHVLDVDQVEKYEDY